MVSKLPRDDDNDDDVDADDHDDFGLDVDQDREEMGGGGRGVTVDDDVVEEKIPPRSVQLGGFLQIRGRDGTLSRKQLEEAVKMSIAAPRELVMQNQQYQARQHKQDAKEEEKQELGDGGAAARAGSSFHPEAAERSNENGHHGPRTAYLCGLKDSLYRLYVVSLHPAGFRSTIWLSLSKQPPDNTSRLDDAERAGSGAETGVIVPVEDEEGQTVFGRLLGGFVTLPEYAGRGNGDDGTLSRSQLRKALNLGLIDRREVRRQQKQRHQQQCAQRRAELLAQQAQQAQQQQQQQQMNELDKQLGELQLDQQGDEDEEGGGGEPMEIMCFCVFLFRFFLLQTYFGTGSKKVRLVAVVAAATAGAAAAGSGPGPRPGLVVVVVAAAVPAAAGEEPGPDPGLAVAVAAVPAAAAGPEPEPGLAVAVAVADAVAVAVADAAAAGPAPESKPGLGLEADVASWRGSRRHPACRHYAGGQVHRDRGLVVELGPEPAPESEPGLVLVLGPELVPALGLGLGPGPEPGPAGVRPAAGRRPGGPQAHADPEAELAS
ncbi:hypothetical protein Trihar35433_8812 [Trichoderma harzianum]|nr:hypothetical protein Trihar35433_8812 [Trichoderma harzianum]